MEKILGLKKVFRSKLRLSAKVRIMESCVMPVLCYGAETWATTRKQLEGIQKTQRAMAREILGIRIRDRVSNSDEIMNKLGIADAGYSIKLKKFKFAGYVYRGNNERWAKRITPFGYRRG